jgi:hypothetical protein
MPPRIQVVQRIEDDAELLEPCDVELSILDVGVFRYDVDVGVELSGRLFRNLRPCQRRLYRLFIEDVSPYFCLGLLDVLVAEQELAIEVAEVDRVKVYNVNLAKTGEDEVLEEFASNTASSDHQDAYLTFISDCGITFWRVGIATSLMR